MLNRWTRARVQFRRARRQRATGKAAGRAATFLTCLAAGLMLTTGALASEGDDLRPASTADLPDLLRAEARRNAELAATVAELRTSVDRLTEQVSTDDPLAPQLADLSRIASLTPVAGPAVTVSLPDAPLSVKPAGVADELLIVHQQDIQAVANALWEGGAEAMTIQGQRVTALTGIKCVGNTVLLHGVPYAPPYVVTAIGDQAALEASLAASDYLTVYREYATAYRLGYEQHREQDVAMPGFQGGLDLEYAGPAR
ncbi:MAG: DUF881 domain-containing protein [Propionicimonas sp.]|nr:DUF881 domain-containing protein [Propionicimonas sp.]